MKLELPKTPNINDIKLIKLNREKVENEIIKPKDDKIMELYQENLKLYNELSRQVNLVNKETHSFLDPVKQLKNEEREKEWDLER